MNLKFSFAGFRHDHIYSLYQRVIKTPGTEIVSACEPDASARKTAAIKGVVFTHDSYEEMFEQSDCDIVAVGDAYGNRSNIVLLALTKGKHVISDKPFCISIAELDDIETALKNTKGKLGCMFDLRTQPNMQMAKHLAGSGVIGSIQAVQFNGMHPLNFGVRPAWYFEPGMHGGTINDIAIHAFDFLPTLTGLKNGRILAMRSNNILFPEDPQFQNSAQVMFELENGACVTGDVSYVSPSGYTPMLESYWRFTVAGTEGLLEFNLGTPGVRLIRKNATQMETYSPEPTVSDYFDDFLAEIHGRKGELTTNGILKTARFALEAQAEADK